LSTTPFSLSSVGNNRPHDLSTLKSPKSPQFAGVPYQIIFIVCTLIFVILFTYFYNIISRSNFILIRR
jgi:preprotein translocase subunit SecY